MQYEQQVLHNSEPVDNRPPTQKLKQANTSKRPRSNQVLLKTVDCHGGSKAWKYQK